jgi:serine protease AprX
LKRKFLPARRSLLATVVVTLLGAFTLAGAGAVSAAGDKPKPAATNEPKPPPRADRDGNKLFESLEARLAELGPDERIEVLVALDLPATSDRVADVARRAGGADAGRRFELVDGFVATVTKGQAQALANIPFVRHVEENAVVRALNDGSRSAFGVAKARLDAPALDGDADGNPAAYSPADLVAAVIDTGVHAAHLDLDGGKVIAFKDFVNGRVDAYDDNGHGTHVAATIAGDGDARADRLYQGVAPAAGVVGVKVLDAGGSGSMETVAAAIEWVVQNKALYGIEAINLSLGASGCSDGTDLASQAVNSAAAAGLVVVVAAGNEGPGKCTIGSPGAATGAVTVGAMADTTAGGFALASFSSRGATADGRVKPDLVAPGVAVTSAQTGTTNGYVSYDGTSMATPFVAGVALLALDANRALTAADVKAKLTATAVDWGRAGADGEYGAGRLDAYAALKAAGAPLTTGPVAPARIFREGTLASTGSYVDVALEVRDTSFPVAATLILPDVAAAATYAPDFDLYLYDPAGSLVAWSERVERQENVTHAPRVAGTYRLRISSYSGGGAFVLDASGGFGAAPAPAPAPAPVTVNATPSSVTVYAGSIRSGGAGQLGADDNAYFAVNSTTWGTRTADWYGRVGGVANGLRSLKVTYRGQSSASCTQTVYVYNWTTATWTSLDSRTLGTYEVEITKAVGGTLADFVSGTAGVGEVAVRVRCTKGSNFYTSTDLLRITYER